MFNETQPNPVNGSQKLEKMRVLFTNDCNGYESVNPTADLVDVFGANETILKKLEGMQIGVRRMGGNWLQIMRDGCINFNHLSNGRKSDYKENEYDLEYKLISGNY